MLELGTSCAEQHSWINIAFDLQLWRWHIFPVPGNPDVFFSPAAVLEKSFLHQTLVTQKVESPFRKDAQVPFIPNNPYQSHDHNGQFWSVPVESQVFIIFLKSHRILTDKHLSQATIMVYLLICAQMILRFHHILRKSQRIWQRSILRKHDFIWL